MVHDNSIHTRGNTLHDIFARLHPGPIIVILEEECHPLTHTAIPTLRFICLTHNCGRHIHKFPCKIQFFWQHRELALARAWRAEGVELAVQGGVLEKVESFQYIWSMFVERLNYSFTVELYSKKCKYNKILVQFIDQLAIKSVHVIIERSISVTYILT